MHPDPDAVALAAHRDRVVEVLRGVRVDGERRQVAEVGAALVRRLRDVVRLEALAEPLFDEECLEHVLDPLRRADDALHAGTSATQGHGDEIALARVAEPLAVDDDRRPGHEVRLAHDELPAFGELDDHGPALSGRRPGTREAIRP